jgi:hypothetical protein
MKENEKNISDVMFEYIELWYEKKNFYTRLGTFSNVNASELTADFSPANGDPALEISLSLQTAEKSFVLIPKEESVGFAFFINDVDAYILEASEFEEIRINSELINFNGGSLGGLINISDITSKLNNLVTEIKALKTYINAHIHPSTGVPPSPLFTGSFSDFNKSDYEDEKIKH